MGEAKINGLIRQQAPVPTAEQMKAIERVAAHLADAVYAEGQKLDAPDRRQAAKMLPFLVAGRVLAKFAGEENMTPENAKAWASGGMAAAITLAMRAEIIEAGRRVALAAQGGQ